MLLGLGILLMVAPSGRGDVPPGGPAANPVAPLQAEQKTQMNDLQKQIDDLQARLKMLREREIVPAPHIVYPDIVPQDWVKSMKWRNIGPANMAGRIVAISVFEADPSTWFVATASGGLLKTTNNGSTFDHLFDKQATVSIGAVAVAPSNRDIVWVGTGEANPRNSVSWGDGVYKSIDGGKSWNNMGLKGTYQTGDVVVHPTNPDIVYVGALGRLYGPGEDRGVYKTIDGGKTWNKVWYHDDKTGVIDVAMHPTDPETLVVAAWERRRDEFDTFVGDSKAPPGTDEYAPIVTHGPGSGLFKTTDGGKSWKKLTKGLPTAKMGRIGLDYFRKDPSHIYAIIDTEKAGEGTPPIPVYMGLTGEAAPEGAKLTSITEDGPAAKAGLKANDIVTAFDKVEVKTYEAFTDILRTKKPDDKVVVSVLRGKDKLDITVTLVLRPGTPAPRGYLGVITDEVTEGLKVREVVNNSTAGKIGIKAGDILLAIDGQTLTSLRVYQRVMAAKKPGDVVKLSWKTGAETKAADVTLEVPPVTVNQRPYSGGQLGGQRPNVQDQQGKEANETGGVYKSVDGGESWTRINSINERPFYFSVIKVDPSDESHIYATGVNLFRSVDGGKTFKDTNINAGLHSDQHALWIDPKDSRHMLIGSDGGFYVTWDKAAHWEHFDNLALGQFYHVAVDNRRPYRVYGGLQDNGTWGGPNMVLKTGGGPTNDDFMYINGGDGFVCRVDAANPDLVYAESQGGNMSRRNIKTGLSTSIRPRGTSRWNWNTPFILSSHNPGLFYAGGAQVFRSVKNGDDLKAISPEITRTGHGSATALSESPKNADVLWVGTDDGAVHLTRDGGKTWVNQTESFRAAGLPGHRWVASIEASRAVEGRCYICFDGHRSNDDAPYLFVTENFGEVWKPIRENLPTGSSKVLREDIVNPSLLWLGTEFGAYASINRGGSWNAIHGGTLPTVAIHEFAQPTTANEIVVATHGRSIWAVDVTGLRQLKGDMIAGKPTLFQPAAATRWYFKPGGNSQFSRSSRKFTGENPPRGAVIDLIVPPGAAKVSLKITDATGKPIRDLLLKNEAGMKRVIWDLRKTPAPRGGLGGASEADLMASPVGRALFGPDIPPGTYRVVLTVDAVEIVQSLLVEADPTVTVEEGNAMEQTETPEKKQKGTRELDD